MKKTSILLFLILVFTGSSRCQNNTSSKIYFTKMMEAVDNYDKESFQTYFFALQKLMPQNKTINNLSDSLLVYYGTGLYYAAEIMDTEIDEETIMKALPYLRTCANKNNPDCAFFMGIIFDDGYPKLKRNLDSALYFFSIAESGTKFKIQTLRYMGDINNEISDSKKAIKYYDQASELGDAESSYKIALIYLDDWTNKKNFDPAFSYISKAKKQLTNKDFYITGIIELIAAKLYANGIGVKMNEYEALNCYKKALLHLETNYMIKSFHKNSFSKNLSIEKFIKKNQSEIDSFNYTYKSIHSKACIDIADLYNYGSQITQNLDSAIHYYNLASQYEINSSASLELGNIYNNSESDYFNPDSVIRYYTETFYNTDSTFSTIPEAIGLHYAETNFDSAFKYNQIAIKKGSKWAYLHLGQLKEDYGLPPTEILDLYKKAFTLAADDIVLKNNAALSYALFVIDKQIITNYRIALDLLNAQSTSGDKYVVYYLYKFYRYGYGTAENRNLARQYLTTAKNLGFSLNKEDASFLQKSY